MLLHKLIKSLLALGLCVSFLSMFGCHPAPQITGHVEEIFCTATFKTITSPDDRQRIYDVISSYAERNSVDPAEVPSSPVFTVHFRVPDLHTMDDIDAHLRFINTNDVIQPVLNGTDATFSVAYDTITLTGSIKITLTFHVDPGAKLYIKPEGGREQDISDSVGPKGDVEYSATIDKGQDFVFARANVGGADKYIKIDVHSGQLYEITKAQYP